MGTATISTMSMGVATTVTAMATSTTAAPLQLPLPLLQAVALQLQLQLLLARGTFLAMATLTMATTTTMTQAQHLLQPLQVVVMLLLLPQLHPQVTLSNMTVCCVGYHYGNAVVGVLFEGWYRHHHKRLYQNRYRLQQIAELKVLLADDYSHAHVANDVFLNPARQSDGLHLFAAVHTLQVGMMAISSIPVLLLPLLPPAQVMFTICLSSVLSCAS